MRQRLLLLVPVFALALAACERGDGGGAPAADGQPAGRPYAELSALADVVAEARAILPRVPGHAQPPPLAPADLVAVPEPRRVLVGEGRLLRPDRFPDLSPRLLLEVFLDARSPPGGHVRVTDGSGTHTWPVLDAVSRGRRDAAFAITLRLSDPGARLRYLVLLGVPYESGGRGYRSLEGYLIHPGEAGGVALTAPVYPVDFGYRHAEPPVPVVAAQALAERIEDLREAFARWEALGGQVAELQAAAKRLRESDVPAEQATRRREDLRDYTTRIRDALDERDRAVTGLRTTLRAVYLARIALADAWREFTDGNAWRWRRAAERRAAYLPLQTLRASYPFLERVYTVLDGDADPALRPAREEMEAALLREQERAPVAE